MGNLHRGRNIDDVGEAFDKAAKMMEWISGGPAVAEE